METTTIKPPLLNNHQNPNFGTVCDFRPYPNGLSKIRIGDWRDAHPDCEVSIAYGASVAVENEKLQACGHGNFLKIEGRGVTRFYWYMAGGGNWDELMMPKRVIADWDTEAGMTKQILWPDLKWYDPYPSVRLMTREELIAEAEQRLAAGG